MRIFSLHDADKVPHFCGYFVHIFAEICLNTPHGADKAPHMCGWIVRTYADISSAFLRRFVSILRSEWIIVCTSADKLSALVRINCPHQCGYFIHRSSAYLRRYVSILRFVRINRPHQCGEILCNKCGHFISNSSAGVRRFVSILRFTHNLRNLCGLFSAKIS